MLWSALTDGGIAVALLVIWYLAWRHWLRKRSRRIVNWVEVACRHHGRVDSVHWHSASRFQVDLHLGTATFRDPHLIVQMAPCEMPLSWLWYRLRKHQETATFAATLDCAPAANLELLNHRWSATCFKPQQRSAKDREWHAQRLGQVVITTRKDWQHDIVNMMDALTASRSYDFLKIAYRREPPQFSATVALAAIQPDALAEASIFDVIRELATSSSPSPF
ncbi:hypothetical protein Acid345_1915 [Candidatus Koribacter versatilis Ellin345]|uniref:Uncharacterized protein n=1 Tax=Koribacter versatilis (strain Ellin345) TaxID=204669 RepID=Q1IQD4_KORVE|nr:hypothetical protein [Candidatus Koribacter versatilis]ABF40916.1 hypothetical protein Acid345_1915 [Candidatus Koribacter versatilis Ellin345]